jgi:Spy/CpxP family protein refolding chaperone
VKKTLFTLLLSCVQSAALMAQTVGGPRSPQDYVKSMTAKLGLTAEQASQATTIFSTAQAAESTARAGMKTAHQALNDAVKSNNTVSIEQLSTTIGNLTAQLTLAQSKARAAFYRILTPEQQTALQQLESQRPARFRGSARSHVEMSGQ